MTMPKSTNTTDAADAQREAAEPSLITVRITKTGVHAGGMILGKGAVVRLREQDAKPLIEAGSAISLI